MTDYECLRKFFYGIPGVQRVVMEHCSTLGSGDDLVRIRLRHQNGVSYVAAHGAMVGGTDLHHPGSLDVLKTKVRAAVKYGLFWVR
jgi:hypothetical protein